MSKVPDYLFRIFSQIYWRLPFNFFAVIFRIRNKGKIIKDLVFLRRSGLILISDESAKKEEFSSIYIAKRTRLHLYFKGIQSRLEQISSQYMLEQVTSLSNGTGWIVDIGANVGELSLAVNKFYKRNKLILIEPSTAEHAAAVYNLKDITSRIFCTGLWFEKAEIQFYHANETGDSSLLPSDYSRPHDLIMVDKLDSLLFDLNIEEIDLLKLEAEGAEPEILMGALETLKITKYITADLGPERGINKLRTYEQCYTILLKAGFEQISRFNGGREVYLFKNNKFQT
jgi:FkbM family methyltransferase